MDNDTIRRQAAIDAIERLILPRGKGETAAEEINRVAWRCAINCAEEMIGHLPSAERRGRWEKDSDAAFYWKCSECGAYLFWQKEEYFLRDIDEPNFCPNCGADMREKKNECDDCFIPQFYNLEDDDSPCRDCGVGE